MFTENLEPFCNEHAYYVRSNTAEMSKHEAELFNYCPCNRPLPNQERSHKTEKTIEGIHFKL